MNILDTKINSMSSLIESVKGIYTLGDIPVVKGSADISVELTEMKTVDIHKDESKKERSAER